MKTFNELLLSAGLNPRDVILLRHAPGKTKRTPHDLWKEGGNSFDQYQSTQKAKKPIFRQSKYWASFVAEPDKSTLFVGIYRASLGDSSKIDWICPLSGETPGAKDAETPDFYDLELQPHLADYRSRLRIVWGPSERAWDQYAHRNDKSLQGQIDLPIAESIEGQKVWKFQSNIERDPALATSAKETNAKANDGKCKCSGCDFEHADAGLFDAHHTVPLAAGERVSVIADLVILCPTCHRRAHRSLNRLMPYSISELREWNVAGRIV